MEHANLIVHSSYLGRRRHEDYEWQGSPHLPLMVSGDVIRRLQEHGAAAFDTRWPRQINIGGYPLKFITDEEGDLFIRNAALYARVDGLNWLSWLRYASSRTVRRLFLKTYYRLILTLEVWGLARVDPNCYPSWRDIGRT